MLPAKSLGVLDESKAKVQSDGFNLWRSILFGLFEKTLGRREVQTGVQRFQDVELK